MEAVDQCLVRLVGSCVTFGGDPDLTPTPPNKRCILQYNGAANRLRNQLYVVVAIAPALFDGVEGAQEHQPERLPPS